MVKGEKIFVDYAAMEITHAERMPESRDHLRNIQAIDHAVAILPQPGQSRKDADSQFMSELLPVVAFLVPGVMSSMRPYPGTAIPRRRTPVARYPRSAAER